MILTLIAAVVVFIVILVHVHQTAQKKAAGKPFSVLLADSACNQAGGPCTVWLSEKDSSGGLYTKSTSPAFQDPNVATAQNLVFWQGPFGASSSVLGLALSKAFAATNALMSSSNGLDWTGITTNYNPNQPIQIDGVLYDIEYITGYLLSSSDFVTFGLASEAQFQNFQYKGQNTLYLNSNSGLIIENLWTLSIASISTLEAFGPNIQLGPTTGSGGYSDAFASNPSGAVFYSGFTPNVWMLNSDTNNPNTTSLQVGPTNTEITFVRWGETSWLMLGYEIQSNALYAFESEDTGMLTTYKQIPVQLAQPAECSNNNIDSCYIWKGLYGDSRGWVAVAAQQNGYQSKVFSYIRGDKEGLRITNACKNCFLTDVRPLD